MHQPNDAPSPAATSDDTRASPLADDAQSLREFELTVRDRLDQASEQELREIVGFFLERDGIELRRPSTARPAAPLRSSWQHRLDCLSTRPAPAQTAVPLDDWSVEVKAAGRHVLSIGADWQIGDQGPDDGVIIGAAQHLLAFVGYGLPTPRSQPDEADDDAACRQRVSPLR